MGIKRKTVNYAIRKIAAFYRTTLSTTTKHHLHTNAMYVDQNSPVLSAPSY